MKFDFDAPTSRRNTNSLKWDIGENELPMWVADMDFKTAPAVIAAVEKRAKEGIFGYTVLPDEWYTAISDWWESRHGMAIPREWLIFCTGVVPAISSIVKRVTNVGDRVVLLTPVYDIFFHSVENAGRAVLESRLVRDGTGAYRIDFADLEKKLAEPLATMMILCNPHNPVGRIWTKEELAKIGALCRAHGVVLLSDEIHCDLTDPGKNYVPFASVSDECRDLSVTCLSASKAFNIAGLQSAAVAVPNPRLREKVERGLNSDEVAEPNCFAPIATVAAFREGGAWLDALREYLAENKRVATEFIKEKIPEIRVTPGEATYLLWLDCERLAENTDFLRDFIRETTGLYLSAGSPYRGDGAHFLRMNIACQKSTLLRGLSLLRDGVERFLKEKQ